MPKIQQERCERTIKIPLTKGKFALIDEKDLELVSQHKWYVSRARNTYYAGAYIKGSRKFGKGLYKRMHEIIMETPKGKVTDHINGNGLDNRRENLRVCSFSENSMNQRTRKNNKSGYKGVFWSSEMNKWRVQISFDYKARHLGYFVNIDEAVKVRKISEKKYFGEFVKK